MTRLAIVEGSGFIDEYSQAMARTTDARISVVVEADPGAAEPLTSLADLKWSVTSWERLFSNHAGEFDAVVIHPNVADQVDTIVAAATEASKDVLVCISPVRCYEALARIGEHCGIVAMVAQPRRFMHYQRSAWASLQSGKIGRLGLLRMHNWMSGNVLEQSDAAVAEMIVGDADLACWMFNDAPEVVYSATTSKTRPLDGVMFHLGFQGGGMAIVDCHRTLGGQESYSALSLIGSAGAVYADDQHNTNLLIREQTFGRAVRTESDWFGHQLSAFVESIAKRNPLTCTVADAIRSVSVANAIVDSFRVGQVSTLEGAQQ